DVEAVAAALLGGRLVGPVRALVDPAHEHRELRVRQARARRHLQLGVVVGDGPDEPARAGVTGDDRGPAFAAAADEAAVVQLQPRLLLLRAVAFVAMLREQRPDLALEALAAIGRSRDLLCGYGDGERRRDK